MISKETEQRSEVLKIAGFALLTPFGRIFMEPVAVFEEFGLIFFLAYLIISIIIGLLGICCIFRSCDILTIRRIK